MQLVAEKWSDNSGHVHATPGRQNGVRCKIVNGVMRGGGG